MSSNMFKRFEDITISDNDLPTAIHNDMDLTEQLAKSWHISTPEERLAQQLNKTHIGVTTSSNFAPTHSNFLQQAQQLSVEVPTFSQMIITVHNGTTNTWDPAAAAAAAADWNTTNKKEDGWGEGPPSYTSISQGTYFGFNSILEAPSTLNTTATPGNTSQAQAQAFSRFKHTPVTFTSAAAEAAQATQAQQHK